MGSETADKVRQFISELSADLALKQSRKAECQVSAEKMEREARLLRQEAEQLIPEIAGIMETLQAVEVFSPYKSEEAATTARPEVPVIPPSLPAPLTLTIRPEPVVSLKNAPRAIHAHNHSNGRPQAFRSWRMQGHQERPGLEGNHDTTDTVVVIMPGKTQKLSIKLGTANQEYVCHECSQIIEWGMPYVRYTNMNLMALRARTPKEELAKLPDPSILVCKECCVFNIELVVWKDMVETYD